jgi:hypothetical protein
MPFVSDAQRRWAHTKTGQQALGGPAKVSEWDQASKGKKLPERVGPKPPRPSLNETWNNLISRKA